MTRTMTRAQMVERICAASPCHGRETIERWSKHWPKRVSLPWMLEHPQRGEHTVSESDRVWLALATDLLPEAARRRVARRAVVRACGYAATACERVSGLAQHARALRAVTGRTPLATVQRVANAARAAARAAAWNAAWDAAGAAWDAAGPAGAAAWNAAWDAAWNAAWDAAEAARAAAGAAAWADEVRAQLADCIAEARR